MVALLCGLAGNVQAVPVAQKPVQVPVSPDAQARIALSNTQPNLLVVPGDRIVGVDSAQGTFTNTGEYGQTGIWSGPAICSSRSCIWPCSGPLWLLACWPF
nr:type-F conjugative transfer system secretin TraK [Escherichia coli]